MPRKPVKAVEVKLPEVEKIPEIVEEKPSLPPEPENKIVVSRTDLERVLELRKLIDRAELKVSGMDEMKALGQILHWLDAHAVSIKEAVSKVEAYRKLKLDEALKIVEKK